jgi:hypothetical protein
LRTGDATGADRGCTPTFGVRVESGRVLIEVEAQPELGGAPRVLARLERA